MMISIENEDLYGMKTVIQTDKQNSINIIAISLNAVYIVVDSSLVTYPSTFLIECNYLIDCVLITDFCSTPVL